MPKPLPVQPAISRINLGKLQLFVREQTCAIRRENGVREVVKLTSAETQLLALLMFNPFEILTRDFLKSQLKNPSGQSTDSIVRGCLGSLREKIGAGIVTTVPKYGITLAMFTPAGSPALVDADVKEVGDIRACLGNLQCWVSEQSIPLPHRELKLLTILMSYPNQRLSLEFLIWEMFGENALKEEGRIAYRRKLWIANRHLRETFGRHRIKTDCVGGGTCFYSLVSAPT